GLVGFGMSCPLLPGGAGSIAGIAIGFVARGAGSGLRPARLQTLVPGIHVLKRDDASSKRHRALASCLSMIFSENRYTLFGIMLWQRSVVHARPDLRLAEDQQAARHLQLVGVGLHDRALVGLAILGIVERAGELLRMVARRGETDRHRRTDERRRAPAGIRVLLVGDGLAGLGVGRVLEPDDGAAQVGAALGHADLGVARIREPHAGDLGLR